MTRIHIPRRPCFHLARFSNYWWIHISQWCSQTDGCWRQCWATASPSSSKVYHCCRHLIFYARIVAIINEIKIQLQTRPAGWGTKGSCRGCTPMIKMAIMMMTWPFDLWWWHLLWCEFRCWKRGQEDWRCWAAFASLEKLRQRDNRGFHRVASTTRRLRRLHFWGASPLRSSRERSSLSGGTIT